MNPKTGFLNEHASIRKDDAMLVLSRKKNERIMISHDIVITVLGIRGNKVRLGIEAPEGMLVDREEVYWDRRGDREFALPVGRTVTSPNSI